MFLLVGTGRQRSNFNCENNSISRIWHMDEIRMLYYLNEQLGKDAKVIDGEVTDLESALPDKVRMS